MALTISALTGNSNTTSSNTITTASITPTAGSLLIVIYSAVIASANAISANTVTSAQGTWTSLGIDQAATATWANLISAWYINGASASAGAITITVTCAGTTNRHQWQVFEITGFNTGTPFGVTGTNTGNASGWGLTLSGTPATTSLVVGGMSNIWSVSPTITPDSSPVGFTELAQQDNNPVSQEVQYANTGSFDTAVDWTALGTNTNVNGCALAFEVKDAGAGGGITYPELERQTRGVGRGVVTGAFHAPLAFKRRDRIFLPAWLADEQKAA